ncbi:MAG: STAS domain-containing protein [Gammaproteobacteria bacterium]|nr:STAS domain-containing protein [Gammaproteobacteria bacterium]
MSVNQGFNQRFDVVSGVFTLPEVMTLESVSGVLQQKGALSLVVKSVDFAHVKQADSSVFAMLLVWSENIDGRINVLNLPADMQSLVSLYNLDSVLALS